MDWLTVSQWSPYAVGAGIGLLSCLTFLLSDKALGCSTAFARTSGMIEKLFRGEKAAGRPYYRKFTPEIDWEWMLVLGIILGAFLSARLSGEFELEWVPERWSSAFGAGTLVRVAVAFAGGVFLGLGSRWAGGCTSGHGISGSLQLAVSGWLAVICFFAGGVATAMVLYHVVAA
ncbi:MAG: YeeE/YedE family protein [Candidatus Brocadiaceae bacterium]|nr:YeeE/YedE family protein [Candidatus Brocadiaceae bacterium]